MTLRRALLFISPVVIVALAGIAALAIIRAKPDVEKRRPEILPPLVRVQVVERRDVDLTVASQGTVTARTRSRLVAEVSGRVIRVAPSFVDGGFFERGDLLVRIEPHDYVLAVTRAEADVARAELHLSREEAEAEVARREWREMGRGDPPPLTAREPQLADARASLTAARAALAAARRDLDRTEVRAPYDGRLRGKLVDVGEYVPTGRVLAEVYAVDFAEVRLPLADAELAFLDLPLRFRSERVPRGGPRVTLRASFAGKTHAWEGRIVRTEGEIDPTSRLVHVVASVADPYGLTGPAGRPPLASGLFVEAEIAGRAVRDVAVLPRPALRSDGMIWVVDEEDRLSFREVEVLRATRSEVLIASGVEDGERVCLSALEIATDGMRVRVAGEGDGHGAAGSGA